MTPLATAISVPWPSRPKPVMSVHACTPLKVAITSAALLFNGASTTTASSATACGARSNLIAVPTTPVPIGLVSISTSPGLAPRVGEYPRGIDRAGDGVAELHLLVLHRVTAEERDAGFAQLVEPALKDGGDRVVVEALFRKARDRERRDRPSAHRVDVAHRIRRGDLSVDIRVVDDRREEVHRLHQRRSTLPRVHTGIVCSPEVDQDARISLRWEVAQDLSELAGSEFARSTRAADHLGQPLPFEHGHEVIVSLQVRPPSLRSADWRFVARCARACRFALSRCRRLAVRLAFQFSFQLSGCSTETKHRFEALPPERSEGDTRRAERRASRSRERQRAANVQRRSREPAVRRAGEADEPAEICQRRVSVRYS